jgi:two-component system, NtrC family, nitrogen regulation sensor histidine kinase NtrY
MRKNIQIKQPPFPEYEKKRRKREFFLIIAILAFVAIITYAETKLLHFGFDFPVSNTILIFILINVNVLLLILVLFLVFRNLVKLLYARKSKVMGARLRTRLVIAFISLTLLPTSILFFFSIGFITNSIEFWFNAPVEQALEESLNVGRTVYKRIEDNNRFFLEKTASQVKAKNLMLSLKNSDLIYYIQSIQKSFDLNAVEIYATNSERLILAGCKEFKNKRLEPVSEAVLKKKPDLNGVRSFSENVSYGELVRTIGTIPFRADLADIRAFIVITTLIPLDLSESMMTISRAVEEYRQIILLKKPIKITYYITLSIVALLVVFCAIWFGFYLAKSITTPIMELAEGTQRVAEGDLSFTIGRVGDDEIGSLVNSFNKMTRDLRSSREQLQLSARKLQKQNAEIEQRRQYIEIVLKNVSAGVITIGANGFVTTINKSAEKMLNIRSKNILHRNYKNLLTGEYDKLAGNVIKELSDPENDSVERPLRLVINGRPRSFMVRVNALRDDSESHIGSVMVFDDLTQLEKAQRMAAWREVARRIAHEVKNPLTPIILSAQRLRRKYSEKLNDQIFQECTSMIIEQVELIRNLVNEFATFARFPAARPKPCKLAPLIEETVALYSDGNKNIDFQISNAENIPLINIDHRQMKQAMSNLVDNAIAAMKNNGTIFIKTTYDQLTNKVRIEVNDNGPGVSDQDKPHLFTPYFSTKKTGMGLGLTIVSTIISDHNGTITARNNKPKGAAFVIELPV